MENMRFKKGDRVRIKSIDWYNKTKNEYGNIDCGNANFIPDMVVYCGEILTIRCVNEDLSYYYVDGCRYAFKDEMIEGLVEEEVGLVDNLSSRWVNEFELPNGYIFKDENGNVINATKIVLEKKEKEYPKTYKECAKLLNTYCGSIGGYNWKLLSCFQKLLICRDAYWKIAGEEMGLGKPWESDWENYDDFKFVIGVNENKIIKCYNTFAQFVLAFPTEEMRDAFYENFKEIIESCKELL